MLIFAWKIIVHKDEEFSQQVVVYVSKTLRDVWWCSVNLLGFSVGE